MKERGKKSIGRSKNVPPGGVAVLENTRREGEDVEGNVRFKSSSYEPIDELVAKGTAEALSREGKDTTIVFHDYD